MRKLSLFLTVMLCFSLQFEAQADFLFFKKKKSNAKNAVTPPKAPEVPKSVKPYAQVITSKAKTSVGFFLVHKLDNRYYFEIPDSILSRDLLVVNRISKSAAENRKGFIGYAGDQIGENMIRFEKGPNDKIFLKSISYSERSNDSLGMYMSVKNSNIQPIMAAFDVKAYKTDSVKKAKNTVVDVTDYVSGDNSVLFFNDWIKKSLSVGGLLPDRSYIDTIKAFPMNLEIRTVKTYTQRPQPGAEFGGDPLTYELNSSIVLLPKVPMKPRYFDPRIAYFATGYTDFDKNPQGIEQISMVTRFRLEPKDEDVDKYKHGELVEPKKPIIFYIDPATPKKWVPYLMQGVNDWKTAFEKAGFKNAIYALEAPKDSTWSLDDARHCAIVYKPSPIPNASGPHVHDPRSGEIIETHINWYHNVMSLLHDWYFIQTAAVNPRAQKMKYDDDLMGQLIRFVSSHEVGHTLGLRHNFGSSATVPVEKLRDKAWVEANGHTPSIMDYARFNYVAQPEDGISEAGLFPRIGIYDDWSIEWGYRWLPQYTPEEEIPVLSKQVVEKLAADKRYTFGTETDSNDPRNQSEDLGDNAMKAGAYGIKNLQRIVPNLLTWTKEDEKDYTNAKTMYYEVASQYARYMGHACKNIAGIYSTPKRVEQSGPTVEFVSTATQKEAMQFLNQQLFVTPMWLVNKELVEKAGTDPIAVIGSVQRGIIGRLINKYAFDKMLQNEAYNGTNAYSPIQMLDDLKKNVWSELATNKPIDIYRRNLQKAYVDALANTINPDATDAAGIARVHLQTLRADIARSLAASTGISKAHLQGLLAQIDKTLETRK